MMNRSLASRALSVAALTTVLALSAIAGCSSGSSGSSGQGGGLEEDSFVSTSEALASKAGWVGAGSGECSLLNGVKGCYNYVADTFACTAGSTCMDLSASKTQLACDGANDCGPGQICCFESVYISNQTKCMAPSVCKRERGGRYSINREQVCDTNSECSSGTCQVATDDGSGRYLPVGWSTCR
jgi:hypothetical protein